MNQEMKAREHRTRTRDARERGGVSIAGAPRAPRSGAPPERAIAKERIEPGIDR